MKNPRYGNAVCRIQRCCSSWCCASQTPAAAAAAVRSRPLISHRLPVTTELIAATRRHRHRVNYNCSTASRACAVGRKWRHFRPACAERTIVDTVLLLRRRRQSLMEKPAQRSEITGRNGDAGQRFGNCVSVAVTYDFPSRSYSPNCSAGHGGLHSRCYLYSTCIPYFELVVRQDWL